MNDSTLPKMPLSESSEALAILRILRDSGFSSEQIGQEWGRQELQDKKSELTIEFIHMLQDKGIDFSIDGENIAVHGTLELSGTSITSLPKNFSVGGGLNLGYTDITRLPDNLSVGGGLDICYTGISSLPDNLKVGGFIHLHPQKITNIAYRKFWRNDDYTVFAAWINSECCIVVNSKIYTLGDFYYGAPTADIEQAARDCVAELEQRRKTGGAA